MCRDGVHLSCMTVAMPFKRGDHHYLSSGYRMGNARLQGITTTGVTHTPSAVNTQSRDSYTTHTADTISVQISVTTYISYISEPTSRGLQSLHAVAGQATTHCLSKARSTNQTVECG